MARWPSKLPREPSFAAKFAAEARFGRIGPHRKTSAECSCCHPGSAAETIGPRRYRPCKMEPFTASRFSSCCRRTGAMPGCSSALLGIGMSLSKTPSATPGSPIAGQASVPVFGSAVFRRSTSGSECGRCPITIHRGAGYCARAAATGRRCQGQEPAGPLAAGALASGVAALAEGAAPQRQGRRQTRLPPSAYGQALRQTLEAGAVLYHVEREAESKNFRGIFRRF